MITQYYRVSSKHIAEHYDRYSDAMDRAIGLRQTSLYNVVVEKITVEVLDSGFGGDMQVLEFNKYSTDWQISKDDSEWVARNKEGKTHRFQVGLELYTFMRNPNGF